MFSRIRRPIVLTASVVAVGALGCVGVATATTPTVTGPTPVSTADPFTGCTAGDSSLSGTAYPDAEAEPYVAVNPTNTNNVIGAVQQDFWSNGGAKGVSVGYSTNGGSSWGASQPAITACSDPSGATMYTHATDPWITFDAAGNAYESSMSCECPNPVFGVLVSKSVDGGATWSAPVTVTKDAYDQQINDKPSITGDPTRPGYVYAVWTHFAYSGAENRSERSEESSRAERGTPMFSRTTDGGAHWSDPISLLPGNPNYWTIADQIAVLPDGTILNIYNGGRGAGTQPSPNQDVEGVMISHDAGLHWSKPIDIAPFVAVSTSFDNHVVDPDNGNMVRAGTNIPAVAVDRRSGAVYVTWADGRFSNGDHPDVVLTRSADGGLSWSNPIKVNRTTNSAAAFMPAIAVTSTGTVGVSYYDFRNNTPEPGLPTDVWLASSHDGGGTWSELHLGGPFDVETAPTARGYWPGDYQGLAAAGNDLLAYFVMATGNAADPTDVYFARASNP